MTAASIDATPALAGFTTVQLLAEVAARMRDSQNSDAGRDLGTRCEEATVRLDGGVLGYRRDPAGPTVLDADDIAVYHLGFSLADAARRFLARVDVARVLTLLDMQPGGCDVLDTLRAQTEAMTIARATRVAKARARHGDGPA